MKLDKAEFINMGFTILARTPGNGAIVLLEWFIEASKKVNYKCNNFHCGRRNQKAQRSNHARVDILYEAQKCST